MVNVRIISLIQSEAESGRGSHRTMHYIDLIFIYLLLKQYNINKEIGQEQEVVAAARKPQNNTVSNDNVS